MARKSVSCILVFLFSTGLFLLSKNCFAAPSQISVALSSYTITGGTNLTATLTLPPNATKAEVVAVYTSDPAVSISTDSVTLLPNVAAPLILSVDTTSELKTVTISASCADYSGEAILTIEPPSLSRIILSTSSGSSNDTVTGLVQLSGPAPPSGETVTLQTSNPAVQITPSTVTVEHGTDLSTPFTLSSSNLKTLASTIVSASIHYKYITSNIVTPVSVSAVSTSSFVLPEGTTIYVTAPANVSSETAKLSDIILFTVATDVYGQLTSDPSSRVIIIPRGNPVICRVRYVRHSKGILAHGRLGVEIDQVEAIDGSLMDVAVSEADYNSSNPRQKHGEIRNVTKNGETHAVVTGRTDSTLVPAELLSIGAAYGLTTLNTNNTASIDVLGIGAVISSGYFSALFTGVPANLPAGVTFAVQTTSPNSIQVRNPIAGE